MSDAEEERGHFFEYSSGSIQNQGQITELQK